MKQLNDSTSAQFKKTTPKTDTPGDGPRCPGFGFLMAVLSVVCFSLATLTVKILTQLHSIEVLIFRGVFQLVFYTTTTLAYQHPIFGIAGHRMHLLVRAVSGTVSLTCIYLAYRLISFGDASTIHFASPAFVTVIAFFWLKERVTPFQIVACILSLVGVVFIAKPDFIFGGESLIPANVRLEGTLLAVTAALAGSVSMIAIRQLKTTPPSVIVTWFSITVVSSSSVMLWLLGEFRWPTGNTTWILLIASGLCGIGDQYFLCLALKYESAGPVSVTRTLNIVLSFLWGVIFLAEPIEWTSMAGAGLITFCVLVLAMVKTNAENPQLIGWVKKRLAYGQCDDPEAATPLVSQRH